MMQTTPRWSVGILLLGAIISVLHSHFNVTWKAVATGSIPPIDIVVKLQYDYTELGKDLIFYKEGQTPDGAYHGWSILRRNFEANFIQDLANSLDIPPGSMFVKNIVPGAYHYTWTGEEGSWSANFEEPGTTLHTPVILVHFSLTGLTVDRIASAVKTLTRYSLDVSSPLYEGLVFDRLEADSTVGIHVRQWDTSMRILYSMEIIGTRESDKRKVFESLFIEDIARALTISATRVEVLYIIPDGGGEDVTFTSQVIVKFRLYPKTDPSGPSELSVDAALRVLLSQVQDEGSSLYSGNVTIRTDPAFGLGGVNGVPRRRARPFAPIRSPLIEEEWVDLEACWDTLRCIRGYQDYDLELAQYTGFFHQIYRDGERRPSSLVALFGQWRAGTSGWRERNSMSANQELPLIGGSLPGAHFDTFARPLSSPWRDLVLNKAELQRSLDNLQRRINKLHRQMEELKAINAFNRDLNFGFQPNLFNFSAWQNLQLPAQVDQEPGVNNIRRATTQMLAELEKTLQALKVERDALAASECETCEVLIDTSALTVTLDGSIIASGIAASTEKGTEVAVFNFGAIDLGPEVNVRLFGLRGLVLMSRSSVRLDTKLSALPGTLGGFAGSLRLPSGDGLIDPRGRKDWSPFKHNGPGGPSAGQFMFTITTSGRGEDEVQRIQTEAAPGQTISGYFRLELWPRCHDADQSLRKVGALTETTVLEATACGLSIQRTGPLPSDISASQLQEVIEQALPAAGRVSVARSKQDSQRGFTWDITFLSAVGDVNQLTAVSELHGIGARISVQTVSEAKSIRGTFQLRMTLGAQGAANYSSKILTIPSNVRADVLRSEIRCAFAGLLSVVAERSDPVGRGKCDDGRCVNGPTREGGYTWTVLLSVTSAANYSVPSPSAVGGSPRSLLQSFGAEHGPPHLELVVSQSQLSGPSGTAVSLSTGIASQSGFFGNLQVDDHLPFYMSYGGSGASHGGQGGLSGMEVGQGETKMTGAPYNTANLSDDLIGGSGGAGGGRNVFDILPIADPSGKGGSGGGVIEISAVNDLIIGPLGSITLDGGNGTAGVWGGGGGSGGALVLSSGGVIVNRGKLLVRGGSGGSSTSLAINKGDSIHPGGGGGGGGGRVAIYAESFSDFGEINVNGGAGGAGPDGAGGQTGAKGTISMEIRATSSFYIDRGLSQGAEGSNSSLLLRVSDEALRGLPKQLNLQTVSRLGPSYLLPPKSNQRPSRVLFYIKVRRLPQRNPGRKREGSLGQSSTANRWMAALLLTGSEQESSSYLGFAATHRGFLHGQSILALDETSDLVGGNAVLMGKWYKVDIRLNWANSSYDILLDDWEKVHGAPFTGLSSIRSVRVHSMLRGTVWFDQIHLGPDHTMGFRCPNLKADSSGSGLDSSYRSQETAEEIALPLGGVDVFSPRQRAMWSTVGLVVNEGKKHLEVRDDTPLTPNDEDFLGPEDAFSGLQLGAFVDIPLAEIEDREGGGHIGGEADEDFFPWDQPPIEETGRKVSSVWYGVHTNPQPTVSEPSKGGIFACSTRDYFTWRREGVMVSEGRRSHKATETFGQTLKRYYLELTDLSISSFNCLMDFLSTLHFENLTDMVRGTPDLLRPTDVKVIHNKKDQRYVLWMGLESSVSRPGLAGVAVSSSYNGPFTFVRSFFPDGNATYGHTVVLDEERESAYLIQPFTASIEMVIPEAVMNPLWESVKVMPNSAPDEPAKVDFALNYHRAKYAPEYDDYHDIYLQIWRHENVAQGILCIDKKTRAVRELQGIRTCLNSEEKVILGQGQPAIHSRFKDPTVLKNSLWRPDSVPTVRAQPWWNNYIDGVCGRRDFTDGLDRYDQELYLRSSAFYPDSSGKLDAGTMKGKLKRRTVLPDRSNCSNIVDNPVHPTLPDSRIGPPKKVETRHARFIAIRQLTSDFLDTTGVLHLFEGGFQNNKLPSDLIDVCRQLSWDAGAELRTSFQPPQVIPELTTARNWKTRYSQYILHYNDRAWDSPACLNDKDCPVNFKDQLLDIKEAD